MTFPFPAFMPGANVLTTLSANTSATSTGATITGPAGIQAGDLLVLYDRSSNGTTTPPTTVVPSGFTSISNVSGDDATNSARQIVSYKIADGSEASATLTGMSDTGNGKMLYVFRGNIAITVATPSTPNAQLTDGDPSAQNVAASSGVVPLVVLAAYGTFLAVPGVDPRTFTVGGVDAKDGEISSNNTNRYLAYKIYNSSPSDVSVDMEDESSINALQSCYIACS